MTDGSSLLLNIADSVATVTIARPTKRNALDTAAWCALAETSAAIAANGGIRAVVLQGDGAHFSAGADIFELREHISDSTWMAHNQATIALALDAFAALPQPTIAVIRGACYGGGAALAAASDFRLCTPDAKFAITPSKLGLTYRLVDCLRVVELVGAARAREILLLAKEVDAATALTWGMVTECVEPALLPTALAAMLSRITSLSSYSARGIKQSLLKIGAGQTNDDAETRQLFTDAFSGTDFAEGAAAFIEKRIPKF
ncbi:MAG: enoyl-CoA hydratase/isomerase family protein [Burkholderiales bacterium]